MNLDLFKFLQYDLDIFDTNCEVVRNYFNDLSFIGTKRCNDIFEKLPLELSHEALNETVYRHLVSHYLYIYEINSAR